MLLEKKTVEGRTEYRHWEAGFGGEMETSELAKVILKTWFELEREYGIRNVPLILMGCSYQKGFCGLEKGAEYARAELHRELKYWEGTGPRNRGTCLLLRSMLEQFDEIVEATTSKVTP